MRLLRSARNDDSEACHCEERSDEAISPLGGNRRLSQVGEEGAGGLQIGNVEAFGEPTEDRGEQGDRLLRPALLPAQAGEARCGAQFPGLRVLPARAVDGLLDGRLGLAHRPGAGERGLAPQPGHRGDAVRS
jgi:hypothetical protein